MTRLIRASLLSALAVALLAASSGSALAASPVSDLHRTGKDRSNSTNWSGYADYNRTFSHASGDWVVPTANCNGMKGQQTAIASPWVGLDGYSNGTVEQTGTDTDCIGRSPYYQAWYEFYPQNLVTFDNITVRPGDHMHADVTHSGSTTTVTLQNVSRNQSGQASSSLSFDLSSAEWILEAPTNVLTNYGSVTFTNASATSGGTTGDINDFTPFDAITLVSKNGRTVKATPGALQSNGSSFTVTFNSQ